MLERLSTGQAKDSGEHPWCLPILCVKCLSWVEKDVVAFQEN